MDPQQAVTGQKHVRAASGRVGREEKTGFLEKIRTYIQFLHSVSSCVGTLEVDKSAEPLVQHADALDVSTPATQAQPLRGCLNKNLLLLRAATVIGYSIGVIRFEKVPKVFLRQLRRHISHPQRSAGASENNQSNTVKTNKQTKQTIQGKGMRSIPPTQVA